MHRILPLPALVLALNLAAAPVAAEEPAAGAFDFDELYALGISEHRLDSGTQVVGWRLNSSWYVGQRDQKGGNDGLSLVWQGDREQVSFSLDEIRFVRRF